MSRPRRVLDRAALDAWSRQVVAAQARAARPPSRLDQVERARRKVVAFYRREAPRRGRWGAVVLLFRRGTPAVWARTGGRVTGAVRRRLPGRHSF